jgi:hypothetical protein
MATHDTLFQAQDIHRYQRGLSVSVQLPWYRSLWLSAVRDVAARVNGRDIPKEDLRFVLQDVEYEIDDLEQQWDTLWFLQDRARVIIPLGDDELDAEELEIQVILELRLLYMQIAPEVYVPNRVVSTLRVDPATLRAA